MDLTGKDGALLLRNGGLAVEQACCCNCCTCNSTFSFYANGRILDGFNSGGFNLQFQALIPGLGFPAGSWQNSGYVSNQVCDANGNLIVRVIVAQSGQAILNDGNGPYITGDVTEYRYYRFDLSGGGCGVITGEPIALPDDAGMVEGAVVDGDVVRLVVGLSDGFNQEGVDSSPLHLDWSGIVIQASCQITCPGTYQIGSGAWNGGGMVSVSCEDAAVDCVNENCECQIVEVGVSNWGFPGVDPFGNSYAHCLLNPLP